MATSASEDPQGQKEESFLYFAYGSNLLTERIHLHNPSAEFICVARLQVSARHPAPATLRPLYRPGDQGFGKPLSGSVRLYTRARNAAPSHEYPRVLHDLAAALQALCPIAPELCYPSSCALRAAGSSPS